MRQRPLAGSDMYMLPQLSTSFAVTCTIQKLQGRYHAGDQNAHEKASALSTKASVQVSMAAHSIAHQELLNTEPDPVIKPP